jgi:hypothetical protein
MRWTNERLFFLVCVVPGGFFGMGSFFMVDVSQQDQLLRGINERAISKRKTKRV